MAMRKHFEDSTRFPQGIREMQREWELQTQWKGVKLQEQALIKLVDLTFGFYVFKTVSKTQKLGQEVPLTCDLGKIVFTQFSLNKFDLVAYFIPITLDLVSIHNLLSSGKVPPT